MIIATGDPFILFKYASQLSKNMIFWVADYRDLGYKTIFQGISSIEYYEQSIYDMKKIPQKCIAYYSRFRCDCRINNQKHIK